jgi:HSP20 family protein
VNEMSLIKIKFGNNVEEEFQKAVDEVFRLVIPTFKNHECIWKPNVDVYESLDEVMVLADLAGLNKEDLHIELGRRKIKISGVRKTIWVLEKGRYYLAEIPHGHFERIIILPTLVDAESAVASYADGILMVRINKLPAGKTHQIHVTTTK